MIVNNRALSWLDFNERVLQEAQDKSVPLIQRLRFLGIFSNNQDEFIRIHVANIVRTCNIKTGKNQVDKDTDIREAAKQLLTQVNSRVSESQKIFEQVYNEILSEMETHNIHIVNEQQLDERQKEFCRDYFSSVVAQRLVPLILKKNTEIPFLKDNSVYLAVKMITSKENNRYAIIQIPVNESCPRFVVLPAENGTTVIIFLDDIIRLCLDEIFFMFNYKSISAYTFRALRDAYFSFDDDISKSLVEKMNTGLNKRLHGQPVKLVYDRDMPADMLDFISTKFKLKENRDLSSGGRYHLLSDLMQFPKLRPDLEDANLPPLHSLDIKPFSSILKVIDTKDILLNYPYHTFNHFVDFLKEAAIDPKVESIYITLYRLAENSKIINALINAAKNGKTVVVVIELFARFDEEQNTAYSELLQKEGVRVIHGVRGTKIHCKLVLIKRKNKGYVYVGTGNFNESTARVYSDFGYFTADDRIVADANAIFGFLQSIPTRFSTKQLTVSPYYMRKHFEDLIRQEIKNAQNGKKAYIYGKFNNLTDEKMIKLLSKASNEGVEIRLIVRSACCLQPQDGNIRVISIIDKFLEHARMMIFHNDGDEKVFIMSADFMLRNLDLRIEAGVNITDEKVKKTLQDVFDIQWNDNVKARDLQNKYVKTNHNEQHRSQLELYEYYRKLRTEGCEINKI
ncbi:MAG: polyphosphate kinase 1 [Prevotellaceae bacterium]|jgi:polyphosphate kinase|nr:polyphosphate kinase 1 [Prevotellaceae bacterium]